MPLKTLLSSTSNAARPVAAFAHVQVQNDQGFHRVLRPLRVSQRNGKKFSRTRRASSRSVALTLLPFVRIVSPLPARAPRRYASKEMQMERQLNSASVKDLEIDSDVGRP
jgi:hypothetical protein